jgi:hypothetical protein
VPWRDVVDMRNFLSYEYVRVRADVIASDHRRAARGAPGGVRTTARHTSTRPLTSRRLTRRLRLPSGTPRWRQAISSHTKLRCIDQLGPRAGNVFHPHPGLSAHVRRQRLLTAGLREPRGPTTKIGDQASDLYSHQ